MPSVAAASSCALVRYVVVQRRSCTSDSTTIETTAHDLEEIRDGDDSNDPSRVHHNQAANRAATHDVCRSARRRARRSGRNIHSHQVADRAELPGAPGLDAANVAGREKTDNAT